jgi:hypothetical protein
MDWKLPEDKRTHPKKSEHVNNHKCVLHLWKPVGIKNFEQMKHSIDANHLSIIETLAKIGWQVKDLSAVRKSGFPDILAAKAGRIILIEIKTGEASEVKRAQIEFMSSFKGYCAFVCSEDEAINLCLRPEVYCLSQKQKDSLAGFLRTWKGNTVTLGKITA